MARVLIVEDEVLINKHITDELTYIGHKCSSAFDGEEALHFITHNTFDLIILDVMLPKLSGFELIKLIKKTPVIFVTAKSALDDRLYGLNLGADDYIVKPFEMPELLARVKVVLRRTNRSEQFFPIDDLMIDFESQKVFKGEKEIKLTAKEFAVLDMFITNKNCVLTREQILDSVWASGYEGESDRVVDVYVQHLRNKLGLKNRLQAVYGVGYRFTL